jgi:hypothetical protein
MLVDAGCHQPVGGLRGEEQVVDADAVVLLPGAGLIIPERIDAVRLCRGADGIREAEIGERAKACPSLRQEERVADPQLRIMDVDLGGDDVVVAGEDQRLFELNSLA